MKPRKILTLPEATDIIDAGVRDSALAVVTLQSGDGWQTFKSRLLERDPNRKFIVLDYIEVNGVAPPPVSVGQYAGVSFRHKSRKIMFATVIEARGRFEAEGQVVPAVRCRWPESLIEMQRRAYYRTPVPPGTSLPVSLWPGGVASRQHAQSAPLGVLSGSALDLSCGGSLVQLPPGQEICLTENELLGVEIQLPDGRQPVLVDAYFRGQRVDPGKGPAAAIQFVGLELTPDGRNLLQRIARCVQNFHRLSLTEDLRAGSSRFRM